MALLLDLREMRGTEARIDRTYPAQTFAPRTDPDLGSGASRDDYSVAGEVSLALQVRRDGDKCRVAGRVQGVLQLSCSRCLDAYNVRSDLTVDLLYLPHSANQGETEAEISEDDLSTAFYRDDQIDLVQMVREQFQLALPMKPLCRSDCRGLCPECGANLNEQRCSCDTQWRDPRLAVLESLLPGRRESKRER